MILLGFADVRRTCTDTCGGSDDILSLPYSEVETAREEFAHLGHRSSIRLLYNQQHMICSLLSYIQSFSAASTGMDVTPDFTGCCCVEICPIKCSAPVQCMKMAACMQASSMGRAPAQRYGNRLRLVLSRNAPGPSDELVPALRRSQDFRASQWQKPDEQSLSILARIKGQKSKTQASAQGGLP